MNLKEAFRFQNRLGELMDTAINALGNTNNTLHIKEIYLYSQVMPGVEDAVADGAEDGEYAGQANELVEFLLYLLSQREQLSLAIRKAKAALPIDMDGEISLNRQRQRIASLLQNLTSFRSGEVLLKHGGTGYRFNAEGNQVSYRCDVRRITTINFDRTAVQRHISALHKRADALSTELDRCLINSQVDYTAPFDVNDSFDDAFANFLASRGRG